MKPREQFFNAIYERKQNRRQINWFIEMQLCIYLDIDLAKSYLLKSSNNDIH